MPRHDDNHAPPNVDATISVVFLIVLVGALLFLAGVTRPHMFGVQYGPHGSDRAGHSANVAPIPRSTAIPPFIRTTIAALSERRSSEV